MRCSESAHRSLVDCLRGDDKRTFAALYNAMVDVARSCEETRRYALLEPELEVLQRPTGLKGFYYNPTTQVVMLGFVCFMCPGLFNALNGLGGGGQLDHTTSANANSALYATFAFFAFFAGYVY